jgi:hypothetical protein
METTAIVKPDSPDRSHAALVGATVAPSWYLRWQFRKQEESASRKHLIVLGYLVIWVYLLSFIGPVATLDFFRPAYLVASAVFLITCAFRKDVTLRITTPVVFAIALQAWSFFTAFHATLRLGRPMNLGRADLYILESIVPFFVSCALVDIDRDARKTISRCVLVVVGFSTVFAWLQFARIPIFVQFAQVYTYKPIDYWDGHPGLRAVGLTTHPNCLAFQTLIGFALIATSALYRKLTLWDAAGLLFFSGGLVMSQGRTFYLVLVVFWILLFVLLIRRDTVMALRLLLACVLCALLAVTVAYKRLGYAFQGANAKITQPVGLNPQHFAVPPPNFINLPTFINAAPDWQKHVLGSGPHVGDTSLDARLSIWKAQMEPIWPKLALTGVGPSTGLLLGMKPEDKWVPMGHVMENGYILMLAMYGIPGLILFSCGLLFSLISTIKVASDKSLGIVRRCAGFVAAVCAIIIAVSCASGNTVDGYMFVPLAWLIGGLAVKSSLDSPLVSRTIEAPFYAGSPAV